MFWPSFNSVAAVGEGQYRAVINTYFALAACAVVTFAVSALFRKGKFDMVNNMVNILFNLGLPSFDTVLANAPLSDRRLWNGCNNRRVLHLK